MWVPLRQKELINKTRDAVNRINNTDLIVHQANMEPFYRNANFWAKYGLRRVQSTGFFFVTCALDLCSEVRVFGFWPFDTSLKGSPTPGHYYNDVTLWRTFHNFNHEFGLILAMHRLGLLKMHIGNCEGGKMDYRH